MLILIGNNFNVISVFTKISTIPNNVGLRQLVLSEELGEPDGLHKTKGLVAPGLKPRNQASLNFTIHLQIPLRKCRFVPVIAGSVECKVYIHRTHRES